MIVNGINNKVNTVHNVHNANTLGNASATFNALIIASTRPNAANGTAISAKASIPLAASFTNLLTNDNGISIGVIAAINVVKAIVFGIAFLTFNALIKANTRPNAANGTAIFAKAHTPFVACSAYLPIGINNVNRPPKTESTILSEIADVNTESDFKHDKAMRIPPKTAIIAAKANSGFITSSFTRLTTKIKAATTADNIVIARVPCIRFLIGTKPSNVAINASIPTAPATIKMFLPILSALLPINLVAAKSPTIIPQYAVIIAIPLMISFRLSKLNRSVVRAMAAIAPEIANSVTPTLPTFVLPDINLVAAISPTIIPPNAVIASVPCSISLGDIPPRSLTTKPMTPIAIPIFNNVLPIASMFSLPDINLVAAISPTIIPLNASIAL